jgi:hypothetical protein
MIPCGYWVGTQQVSREKGDQHRQPFLKTTLEKLAKVFMFSSEVLGLEEVCPAGVIVNWKLHEIFPILTVAGLMFKLYRKEQS